MPPVPPDDTWRTQTVTLNGGVRLDLEPVAQSEQAPGTLILGQNYESGTRGGYKRLAGCQKYSTTVVPGSGSMLGTFVFNSGVVACRGTSVYFGTGTTWTSIGASVRTGALKYRAAKYNWSASKIIIVDGVNYPMRYTAAGVSDNITDSSVTGAACIVEHKLYMFYGVGTNVVISQPSSEAAFSGGSGAATINIGYTVVQLYSWRDDLYVFTPTRIAKITGKSSADWALVWVTRDLGCSYPDSVKELGGDLLYLGPDGLRTITSSEKYGDINLENVAKPIFDLFQGWTTLYTTDQVTAIINASKGQYRIFKGKSDVAAASAEGLMYCLTRSSPEWFSIMGMQVSCGDSSYTATGTEVIVHGDTAGYVYQQEATNAFDGANVVSYLQIPYLTFDDPGLRKTLYTLKVHIESEGIANLDATVFYDNNDTTLMQPASVDLTGNQPTNMFVYGWPTALYGTAEYGLGPSIDYYAYLTGSGFNASIRIDGNDIYPPHTIKQMLIEYDLGGRT